MTRSLPSLLVALLLPSLSFPAFAKLSNKRFSPLSSLSRESQGGLFQGRRLEQPESKDWPELKLEDRVDFGSVRMLLAEHWAAAGDGGTRGTGSDGFGQPWTYVEDACLLSLANGLERRMPLLAICRCAAILLPHREVSQAQARMRKHQELKRIAGRDRLHAWSFLEAPPAPDPKFQ